MNKPEEWFTAINFSAKSAGLATVAEQFKGWASQLTALITDGETDPILRSIYALPVDHRWKPVPGLTLLGDAAHLMSPFAGEGANLAMYDGAQLAKALIAAHDNPYAAVAAYESDLFPRSAKVADESAQYLVRFFGDSAPHSVVALFRQYLKDGGTVTDTPLAS